MADFLDLYVFTILKNTTLLHANNTQVLNPPIPCRSGAHLAELTIPSAEGGRPNNKTKHENDNDGNNNNALDSHTVLREGAATTTTEKTKHENDNDGNNNNNNALDSHP